MSMKNNILAGLATMLLGRSRRLRWVAPALPIALAAFQMYKKHRAQSSVAGRPQPTQA